MLNDNKLVDLDLVYLMLSRIRRGVLQNRAILEIMYAELTLLSNLDVNRK